VASELQRAESEDRQPSDRSSQSVAGLLQRLTHEVGRLFHQELALAAAELTRTLGRPLAAITTTAAGGAVLFAGLLVLVASAVLGLSHIMAAWLAALIVGAAASVIGVVTVVAGIHALPETLRPARSARSLSKDKNVLTRKK
jgi:Putative Actinobacterial Holin-X, holin superfamily III